MVLLRNDSGVLPFDPSSIRRLAVVGELAQHANTGDRGSSRVSPPDVITFLDGIRRTCADRTEVVFDHGRDLDRAAAAAQGADAVVIVAGFRHDDEGENLNSNHSPGRNHRVARGGDRESLRLRPREEALIQHLAARHPRCAVVLVGGSAIVVEPWKDHAPAILMAWYAGMAGGTALARVLFGEVNPGGKLPFTVPADESQLPPFDAHAADAVYGYHHGYTKVEKEGLEPTFRFGFGLSYTRFTYQDLGIDATTVPSDGEIVAHVVVRNAGERAGDEVAQCYVGFPAAAVDRPHKLLRGFTRVDLRPGERRELSFRVPARDLARYEPSHASWIVDPGRYTIHIGPSSDDRDLLVGEFRVR